MTVHSRITSSSSREFRRCGSPVDRCASSRLRPTGLGLSRMLSCFALYSAGERFTALISDIYTENFTSFMTAECTSDKVLLQEGVKQGCPSERIVI